MSSTPATAAPTKFQGKYRVLAQLGQGGTANVMLAVARGPSGFNKLVVLKSMRGNVQSEPEMAAMFLSEARLAARLNHHNVVQTNEVFESAEGPVIVMEYLEGQALSQVAARARGKEVFPLRMHLRVICEALAGLQHAHELTDFDGRPLGVVHRDVSPHNVFITYDGQVKVLDFGIAKLSGAQADTATGVLKGKLRYMAPEQITGESVDRRADIFATGVMLWEAATGQRMWRDVSDVTIMNRILNDELPKLREAKSDVPEPLAVIIDKCLAADPNDRYPTAEALLHDLEDFLGTWDGTAVRARDLGAVVSQLFSETRVQMRKVIEEQLAKVASLKNTEEVDVIELTSFGTHSGYSAPTAAKSRNNGLLVLALSAVIVAGAATWLLRPEPSPAPAAPTAPAAPAQVQVRITAFPATSKLYLDGQMLPSNPYFRQYPKDAKKQLHVEVRADGHVSETRDVPLDQNAEIVVTLSPLPKAAEQPAAPAPTVTIGKTPRTTRPTTTPSTTTAAPPKANCDPPFVIDERGMKRYKPECF
jgi:serine/threonine-protein kinase